MEAQSAPRGVHDSRFMSRLGIIWTVISSETLVERAEAFH